MTTTNDNYTIGSKTFNSRLLVGTGKYASLQETKDALMASGAEIITVALRRIDFESNEPSILTAIDKTKHTILPNTAGCYTAKDAIRTCHLARELDLGTLVKLEVIGDETTLFPDDGATIDAAKILINDGFTVLPYCSDNPVTCQKLQDIGCAAVMPLAAPIGSGLGICNPYTIRLILESATIPVIVDAGVGTASDAAIALELGCTAVLMNTGIAAAKNPVLMAHAMREAVSAGRKAFLAGRMQAKLYASASSPLTATIHE